MDKYIYIYIFEKYYAFTMITFILHFFFFFCFVVASKYHGKFSYRFIN